MDNKRVDPRKQFSKKLARWTAIFWFLYMTWLSVLFLYVPSAAQYCVYMGIIATAVMLVNEVAYTANSIQEKLMLAMIDRTKLELGLGSSTSSAEENETTEDEGDAESEVNADG